MELHMYSAGKIQSLPHRFFPDIPNHHTKLFWLNDKHEHTLPSFSQPRGMNYYIDIGQKIRIKPEHIYILPSFSFSGIISDENMLADIYYVNLDITPPRTERYF